MNVVATYKTSNGIFQSQSYDTEEEKQKIISSMLEDAQACGKEVNISDVSDESLHELLSLI